MKQTVGVEHQLQVQFDQVWVREAVFRDLPDEHSVPVTAAKNLDDLNATLQVTTSFPEGSSVVLVTLAAELKPSSGRRYFEQLTAAVEGAFSMPGGSPRDALEEFAHSQAPVLLFPYLRQVITALTSSSRLGALILPPINMQQVVQAMRQRATESETASKA